MIQHKQPDVVFCCYRSPNPTKYKDFEGIGTGRIQEFRVGIQGQIYTCVNGFHLSYALNFLEDRSALRSLFTIQATQACRRAHGTWRESTWMTDVGNNCAAIVQIDRKDKQEHPNWTKHDFQRERFEVHINAITRILHSLKYGAYDKMTTIELYYLILKERYNVLLPNCLLLMKKIVKFEEHGGDHLQSKGFTQLREREERDIGDLRRNVEKGCEDFLQSLGKAAGVPFQVEKGRKGLFDSADLGKVLIPDGTSPYHFGLHYNLRISFRKLLGGLNAAYTFQRRNIYNVSFPELAQAFNLAAGYFEWALGEHVRDLELKSQFGSLNISSRS